jgi:Peptidase family M48
LRPSFPRRDAFAPALRTPAACARPTGGLQVRERPEALPRHPRLVDCRGGGRAVAAIANIFQFSLLFGGEDEDAGPLGWIGLLATIIVAPLAASLLQLAGSRQREYFADATGAQFLGRAAPLADAPRYARARLASPPGDGQPGDRVALRRQPIGTTGCGDPLRDASTDRPARTPAASARR